MGSVTVSQKPWITTPLIRSVPLSEVAGCIFLKLENLQPSSSFKSRGIGNLMNLAVRRYPSSSPPHFYCSSGGNAGLACATAAISLECSVTIVVPLTTSKTMIKKLEALGATVYQVGENWAVADEFLREKLLEKDQRGVYVSPFDHEDIWDGASTIMDEIVEHMLPFAGFDGIVCSVGGGGLVNGIMLGLEKQSTPGNSSALAESLQSRRRELTVFMLLSRQGSM